MTNEEPKLLNVADHLRHIYATLDDAAAPAIVALNATCAPGCSACCNLLTLIGPTEGILIAETLLGDPATLMRALPKLREQALALDAAGTNKAKWWAQQRACPFLVDHRCSIYEVRPSCCRYHVVTSPKENCAHGAADPQTASIDLMPLEAEVFKFNVDYCNAAEMDPVMTTAPIPVMVLAVLRSMAATGEIDRGIATTIAIATAGVAEPDEWCARHARDLVDEGDGFVGEHAEEYRARGEQLFQIGKKGE